LLDLALWAEKILELNVFMCNFFLKCIHCGQLILRKISKIGATRCQILRLKCTKFDFRWGYAPDPAGGAYSTPPNPLDVFKGPTSKGKERKEEGSGTGKGGEGVRRAPHFVFSRLYKISSVLNKIMLKVIWRCFLWMQCIHNATTRRIPPAPTMAQNASF